MTNKNFYERANELIRFKDALKNTIYRKTDLRSIKITGEKKLKQLDLEGNIENLRVKTQDKNFIKTLKLKTTHQEQCAFSLRESFKTFETAQKQLTFLKTVKGGKTVFKSGVLGFTPNSQFKYFATRIQKSVFLNKKKKIRLSNLMFLSMTAKEQEKKKKFYVFKAPYKSETLKIYPYTSKNKIKNKLNSYKNQINFVFTLKQQTKNKQV